MYPLAFTLIIVGHFFYYVGKGVLGEAKKAWLGEDQEKGVMGIGTAKRKIHRGNMGIHGTVGMEQGIEHESAGVV
jgi:solute carrier family 35 protein F1/2